MTKKTKTRNKIKNRKNYLKKIKNKFIKELILKIYKLELLIRVKTNLLDFRLGAYIVQRYKDRI